MVDAVGPLVTGAAVGADSAAGDPAADGAFPTAMARAFGSASGTASGKALPVNDGSSLPAAGVIAAAPAAVTLGPSLPIEGELAAVLAPNPTDQSPTRAPVMAAAAVMNALEQVAEAQAVLPAPALESGGSVPTANEATATIDNKSLPVEQTLAADVAPALVTSPPAEQALHAVSFGAQPMPVVVAAPVTTRGALPANASSASKTLAADATETAPDASMPVAVATQSTQQKSLRRQPAAIDTSTSPAPFMGQAATALPAQTVPQTRDGDAQQSRAVVTGAAPKAAAARPSPAIKLADAPVPTTTTSDDDLLSIRAEVARPPQAADPAGAGMPAPTPGSDNPRPVHTELVFVPSVLGAEAGNSQAAALLVAAAPLPAVAVHSPTALELPVSAQPGTPGFAGELGDRLLWLVNRGAQEARLQLNPRELGPIEVRLGFSDGAAQVSFNVQHAGTAAAVQQSLPQLRELLAQQGLQLGQAAVFHQNAGNADQAGQEAARQENADRRGVPGGLGAEELVPSLHARVIGRGLIDAYA